MQAAARISHFLFRNVCQVRACCWFRVERKDCWAGHDYFLLLRQHSHCSLHFFSLGLFFTSTLYLKHPYTSNGTCRLNKKNLKSGYWKYAQLFARKDIIQTISKLDKVKTDLGRGRAWLRLALNEYVRLQTMHTACAGFLFCPQGLSPPVELDAWPPPFSVAASSILRMMDLDTPPPSPLTHHAFFGVSFSC